MRVAPATTNPHTLSTGRDGRQTGRKRDGKKAVLLPRPRRRRRRCRRPCCRPAAPHCRFENKKINRQISRKREREREDQREGGGWRKRRKTTQISPKVVKTAVKNEVGCGGGAHRVPFLPCFRPFGPEEEEEGVHIEWNDGKIGPGDSSRRPTPRPPSRNRTFAFNRAIEAGGGGEVE